MPAHSYRVNNCGNIDLLLDKFVFNTPPGIKHIANLTNFGGTANFSGNSFTVTGVAVPSNDYRNFTIDYEYESGPACCRYGNIVISTVTGKTSTIFTTINVSDPCVTEVIIAQCSISPAQTTLTFNVPATAPAPAPVPVPVPAPAPVPVPVSPELPTCSLTPNNLTWSVSIPAVPAPPVITCSLLPNWQTWSVTIPAGSWSIYNTSATTLTGGSEFKFAMTAPASALGSTFSFYVVKPGTTTLFNDSGITGYPGSLGYPNLPVNPGLGAVINVLSQRVTYVQTFQVILTDGALGSSNVLARTVTCTINP